LLFTPSALWTAANRPLPVLFVMHNNRQYQNTVEHAWRVARERGRPVERRYLGSAIADPPVDFALLARSMGVWGAGPVTTPDALPAVLAEALAVVDSGEPALVDVVTTGA
jgi:thiamine pyrophosphate-dependent acetolactate synthase large subunit-like protein